MPDIDTNKQHRLTQTEKQRQVEAEQRLQMWQEDSLEKNTNRNKESEQHLFLDKHQGNRGNRLVV